MSAVPYKRWTRLKTADWSIARRLRMGRAMRTGIGEISVR
jgi:hypothetical protein